MVGVLAAVEHHRPLREGAPESSQLLVGGGVVPVLGAVGVWEADDDQVACQPEPSTVRGEPP